MRYRKVLALLLILALVLTGCGKGDNEQTSGGQDIGQQSAQQDDDRRGADTQGTAAGETPIEGDRENASDRETGYLLPSERAEQVQTGKDADSEIAAIPAVAIPTGSQPYFFGRGEEGVSILCSDTASLTKNNLQGIVIQLNDEDMIPGVSVRWVSGVEDVPSYVANKLIPSILDDIEDNYLSSESPGAYMMAGKELYGTTITYTSESGKTVVSRVYVEACEGGVIVYRSEGYLNRTQAADRELEFVIRYAKKGTTAYANTYCATPEPLDASISLIPSDANKARLYQYESPLVSMKIPEGWNVVTWGEGLEFTVYAYDPARPDRQLFINLKSEGLIKSEAARRWYRDYYGDNYVSSFAPILKELTAEAFFKVWNDYVYYMNQRQNESSVLARMLDFEVIENFGPSDPGGDLLRAKYMSLNGIAVEGLFTATPLNREDEYHACSEEYSEDGSIDIGFNNVFTTVYVAAPTDEFLEWADILLECLSSVVFDQNFLDSLTRLTHVVFDRVVNENEGVSGRLRDQFVTAWNDRDTSYDIRARKEADEFVNAIRIYDTRTGSVYRADASFLSKNTSDRYELATDEMYLVPISGYLSR